MSDTPGKVQLIGISKIKGEKVFVLYFLQGRNPQWVDIPFFAQYAPKATWFGQSKPTFRGKRIFLQKQNMPPLKNASIVLFE